MKKIVLLLACLFVFPLSAAADESDINKIMFQVSAKYWLTTQTALLTVNINSTLNNADLVSMRLEIMNNLKKIAAGDWHIIQFDRSQDNSGLEKLYAVAQARITQENLSKIYQNAKSVSKPGSAYSVASLEFQPSLEEREAGKALLRENLYNMVKDELTRINKVYPDQHYTINNLYIMEGEAANLNPKAYQMKEAKTLMAASSAPLIVSNEIIMTAMVEAGSVRKGEAVAAKPNP